MASKRHASRSEAYRNKAEEIFELAERVSSKEAKEKLRGLAIEYLNMAATLERIAAQESDPKFKL